MRNFREHRQSLQLHADLDFSLHRLRTLRRPPHGPGSDSCIGAHGCLVAAARSGYDALACAAEATTRFAGVAKGAEHFCGWAECFDSAVEPAWRRSVYLAVEIAGSPCGMPYVPQN